MASSEEYTNKQLQFVYKIKTEMNSNRVLLCYEGEFSQEITKSVLSMTEKNLDLFQEDQNVRRKVFNVMVECLQNICKHTESAEEDFRKAIFLIGLTEEGYFIATGNLIMNENVDLLRSKLLEINLLDKEGLKMLHKEVVTKGSISDRGGAGLGLIDIARKSGRKLEFSFEPVSENVSFYTLLTRIPRTKE